MNIGIIFYSATGNTRQVMMKLGEALVDKGHRVTHEEIEAEGKIEPLSESLRLTKIPDVSNYDAVVFASPVMAFSLNPVMKKYLSGISPLNGKKVALLITKHLSWAITGVYQALGKMKKVCLRNGAQIVAQEKVIWKSENREQMISDAVKSISSKLLLNN